MVFKNKLIVDISGRAGLCTVSVVIKTLITDIKESWFCVHAKSVVLKMLIMDLFEGRLVLCTMSVLRTLILDVSERSGGV